MVPTEPKRANIRAESYLMRQDMDFGGISWSAHAGPFTRKILRRKDPKLIRMLQEVALDKRRAREAGEVFIKRLTDSECEALLVRQAFQKSLDAIFDQTES